MILGKTPKNTVYVQKQDKELEKTLEKIESKIAGAYKDNDILFASESALAALSRLEDTAIEIRKRCGLLSYVSGTKIGTFGDLLKKKNK